MMLRALFDEKRRTEIRDALKAGKTIEFRGKLPEVEIPGRSMNEVEVIRQMIRDGERAQESLERLETINKGQEAGGAHSRITQAVAKIYGSTRYALTAGFGVGGLDQELARARMASKAMKAAASAEGNQKPKEKEPEESGKNQ
jgi:hypothetical protein